MAAEIKATQSSSNTSSRSNRKGGTRRPQLINKLEGSNDDVTAATFIPREDGVITISDDKYVGNCLIQNKTCDKHKRSCMTHRLL